MSNEWDKMKTYLNRDVGLCMSLDIKGLCSFIDYWSGLYSDKDEYKYEKHIGKKLTLQSRQELFEWKNGGTISDGKTRSIEKNYPLDPPAHDELEDRYLNHKEDGGAIWNIFYLHIISPEKYPIFDQHVYRAMRFMEARNPRKPKPFKELELCGDSYKFEAYTKFREFYEHIRGDTLGGLKQADGKYNREIDRALFWFGKLLKTSCNHQRYF